jgi:hypothetical protein
VRHEVAEMIRYRALLLSRSIQEVPCSR